MKTHNMYDTPEYRSFHHMKQRCLNPNNTQYNDYGGRGITICNRWVNSFENFYSDMGPRPEGKTLDRVLNDGNYEPSNCEWRTPKEQMNNKRPKNINKIKGYCWHKSSKKWVARITYNGRNIRLGSFNTEEEARTAYVSAFIHYYGEPT